jgi:glycosyltransferase involved in cell wall biosynthesis
MTPSPSSPTVSVVMIFLDAEVFLAEAIESVLAQTYQDYELILVDDGSTDASTAMAKDYAARHPGRIRYTEHEGHQNRGMSASRNHGVAMGTGRLISFLDSDDVWLPTRLARFVSAIDAFPEAAMVYGPTMFWYSWEADHVLALQAPPKDQVSVMALPTEVLIAPPYPLQRFLDSFGGALPGICSLIFRRTAFEAIGGCEPEFRGLYEDQVFLSKMVARHPVVVIPDVLDLYRQHAASCCNQAIVTGEYDPYDLHPARIRFLTWLEAYCATHGINDPGLMRALNVQLRPYRSRLAGFVYRLKRVYPRAVEIEVRRRSPPALRKVLKTVRSALWALRGRKEPPALPPGLG